MYIFPFKLSRSWLHDLRAIERDLLLLFIGVAVLVGIGYAVEQLVSSQTFSRHYTPAMTASESAGALTIFDVPQYAEKSSARQKEIFRNLVALRDAIGLERAYVLTYAYSERLSDSTKISRVFEVVKVGVTPQHQRLQGLVVSGRPLLEAVSYDAHDKLPFIYSTELYDNEGRIFGFFGADRSQNFLLLQPEHFKLMRQTIEAIEAALSLPKMAGEQPR